MSGHAKRIDERVDDLEQLRQEVDRLFEKIDTQRNWLESIGQQVCVQADRRAALEGRSELAPDPVCENCGHYQSRHVSGSDGVGLGPCTFVGINGLDCKCPVFVAPAQPAPEGEGKCQTCKGTTVLTLWRYENQVYGIICPVCHGGAR